MLIPWLNKIQLSRGWSNSIYQRQKWEGSPRMTEWVRANTIFGSWANIEYRALSLGPHNQFLTVDRSFCEHDVHSICCGPQSSKCTVVSWYPEERVWWSCPMLYSSHVARELDIDLRARLRAELDRFINQRSTIKRRESKGLSRPKHIKCMIYVGLEDTLRQAPTSYRIGRLEISRREIFERIRAVHGWIGPPQRVVSLEDCELTLAPSQGHTLASVCLLGESVVLRFHGILYPPGQSESESLILLFMWSGTRFGPLIWWFWTLKRVHRGTWESGDPDLTPRNSQSLGCPAPLGVRPAGFGMAGSKQ